MPLLTLGSLELAGFEIPSSVSFGGAQRVTVHKLLGGGRVIDTMGRDDAALTWSGTLTGNDAGDRARTLDAVRAIGDVQQLSWDAFSYNVIVTDLKLEYCSPWWIKYHITCTVVSDLAQGVMSAETSILDSVESDLTSASSFTDVSGALALLSSGMLPPDPESTATTIASLSATLSSATQGISNAEIGLNSNNVTSLVSSSGTLAQLICAQGYLQRASTNLKGLLV